MPNGFGNSEAHLATRSPLATALTLMMVLLLGSQAHSDEQLPGNHQRKSMALATVLALVPVPATALAYSGNTGQAIGSGVLGVVGLSLIGFGSAIASTGPSWGVGGRSSGGNSGNEFAIAGVATYIVSLAWDGIGGLYYTRKHNRDLDRAEYAIRPLVTTDGETVLLGLRMDF